MRRLAAVAVMLILGSALLASAAYLEVDGGVLQVFEFDVDLQTPEQPDCVAEESLGCQSTEKVSQLTAEDQPSTSVPESSTSVARDPGSSVPVDTPTTSAPTETSETGRSGSANTVAPPPTTETSVDS